MSANVNEIVVKIIPLVMQLIFYAVGLLLTAIIFPWLKQQVWYSVILKFVKSADKLASSGQIAKKDKKEYVLDLMQEYRIPVNDITLALLESAVREVDNLVQNIISAVEGDENDAGEEDPDTALYDESEIQ